VITEAELRTGAAKSGEATKIGRLVKVFLRPLTILGRVLLGSSCGSDVCNDGCAVM